MEGSPDDPRDGKPLVLRGRRRCVSARLVGEPMRADTFLLFVARRRTNAANVHQATALIRGYEMAIEAATDPRSRDRREARAFAMRAETALRQFAGVSR